MIELVLEEYPKTVKLKNGEEITVRPLEPSDFEALVRFFKDGVEEEETALLKDNIKDPTVIKRWCENIDYKRVFPLIAEKDGKIIADGTLHMRDFGWAQFIGKIRFVVSKDYRGKGVGTILIRELIQAGEKLNLDKLWAEVVDVQEKAERALRKSGFEPAGTLPQIAKDNEGRLHDVHILIYHIFKEEY
ncbi:MAG: GNAT family N-acetyltransferase [Deferribacteres bacterium]|nr:GNAT family N-acetyltransferase [Deferribacteres bacterium]